LTFPVHRTGQRAGLHAGRKVTPMDLVAMLNSPLARTGRAGQFLRLVLAEAGSYGMPGSVIVVLDDLASMLGLYQPIPEAAATHVSGPMVAWRTNPQQPSFQRIDDVERLAYKERALIAFGGGPPGEMVGRAEIVIAMGNIAQGTSPPGYYAIFQWASLHVIQQLTGDSPEKILADPSKRVGERSTMLRSCSLVGASTAPIRPSARPSGAKVLPQWARTQTTRGSCCDRLPRSSWKATGRHGSKR
jgi:hypothetical protein